MWHSYTFTFCQLIDSCQQWNKSCFHVVYMSYVLIYVFFPRWRLIKTSNGELFYFSKYQSFKTLIFEMFVNCYWTRLFPSSLLCFSRFCGIFTHLFFFSWKKLNGDRTLHGCPSDIEPFSSMLHQTYIASNCSSVGGWNDKIDLVRFRKKSVCKQGNLKQFIHIHTPVHGHTASV